MPDRKFQTSEIMRVLIIVVLALLLGTAAFWGTSAYLDRRENAERRAELATQPPPKDTVDTMFHLGKSFNPVPKHLERDIMLTMAGGTVGAVLGAWLGFVLTTKMKRSKKDVAPPLMTLRNRLVDMSFIQSRAQPRWMKSSLISSLSPVLRGEG